MENATSAPRPVATPDRDPIWCPDCGATPDIIKGGAEFRCLQCYCGGPIFRDGSVGVAWRYAGLNVGGNASM